MEKSQFNLLLGTFIQEKRKQLNWSQSDLSVKLGNNAQNISRIERGGVTPTLFWLIKLAEAFEQSPSELMKELEIYIQKTLDSSSS